MLHNRFQCLQNFCASTDDVIHNEIHMIKSVNKHRENSVHVSAVGDKLDHVKQHLEECKLPQFCSNVMLQPMLAVQENIHYRAIKIKLGYSTGYWQHAGTGNVTLIKKEKVGDCIAFDSICCEQNRQCSMNVISDTQTGPQLASTQNCFFEGNKNKIGSLDGKNWDVRNKNKLKNLSQSPISAGVDKQVSTANLSTVLDGNCYHNNLTTSQCGNDIMEVESFKNYYNVVSNQNHQFGFCPVSLYDGNPVHWNIIPDEFQAHKLTKLNQIFWLPGFLFPHSLT